VALSKASAEATVIPALAPIGAGGPCGLRCLGRGNDMGVRMYPNIFEFWSVVGMGETEHPADSEILPTLSHHFDLECLPGCWRGPLRTAPVVLLFLAPGWSQEGPVQARQAKHIARNARMRTGYEPLPEREDTTGFRWAEQRTKLFAPWEELRTKLAMLNIVPYHSEGDFKGKRAIKLLPSCRMTLAWAHAVLFPQARRGERIVVCLRAAKQWGLETGRHEGHLYAPETVRSGYMKHGPMREEIIAAVRQAIK
jgi:hypothetical protein